MKKTMAVVLGAAMTVSMLAVPAMADDTLVIGFAQLGQESGWRDAETNDILTYDEENDDVEFLFSDAQQQQANQIDNIRSYIQQGVDVIAFPPVVETGWEGVLQEAADAGIPVILVDRGVDENTPEDLYATVISSDFVWEGEQAAQILVDAMGGSGKVVELEGTVGASAANERKEGFDKYIEENCPDVEIIESQSGDFTRALGKEVMEAALKKYDEIDGVFAHNDDMALGAIEAIKEAGLKPGEDIKIVGCDGVMGAFEAMVDGEMNGTVECNPCLAGQIVDTAKALIAGEEVEKWVKSNDGVFTADTAAEDIETRVY